MEEKIKEIVSVFIRIPAEQIGPSTIVDRSVMNSSILLHRMYAKLADAGVTVEDYTEIKNFSDLLRRRVGGATSAAESASGEATAASADAPFAADPADQPANATYPDHAGTGRTNRSGADHSPMNRTVHTGTGRADRTAHTSAAHTDQGAGLGIDIEAIASLPVTHDFRKEEFYKMNFTAAEIAYCVLQPDPYASFAGLFAAKEAIVKASGDYRNKTFNAIEISHSSEGRPIHPGFNLSVSHTAGLAVGVAVRIEYGVSGGHELSPLQLASAGNRQSGSPALWLALIALAISLIAIVIVLSHQ
jgi:phosphopantetheine--protein transferase-like protein